MHSQNGKFGTSKKHQKVWEWNMNNFALINTISHSAVKWAATIWQKRRRPLPERELLWNLHGRRCGTSVQREWECDREWKTARAGRGRQPGNPTFLRPPSASVGGGWQEKGGTANDGNMRRFPFSSLDSYSPEIFHPPPHRCHSHHHLSPRTYYCTFS